MKRALISLCILPLIVWLTAAAGPLTDHAGFKDPALFTRLPHFFLPYSSSVQEAQYDFQEYLVTQGKAAQKQRVEGHKLVYCYVFDASAGSPNPSLLQIVRNYQAAAAKIGGKTLYDGNDRTTLFVAKNGQETWVEVEAAGGGNSYYLRIVEKQSMQQDVVANADAFQTGLKDSGHVEVPGIFFDFGKADLKPESEPALREVAKLMQSNAALRVWVVGHTDNVGSADTNQALSDARAAAVVRALTQQMGIDQKRLTPHGVGPYSPVASNATDEGRAKNRRVELVAQP